MGSSPLWHILFWDENRRRLTTAMICRTARHHQVSSDFRTRRPAIVGLAGAGRGRLRGSFWNWKDIRPKRKRSWLTSCQVFAMVRQPLARVPQGLPHCRRPAGNTRRSRLNGLT